MSDQAQQKMSPLEQKLVARQNKHEDNLKALKDQMIAKLAERGRGTAKFPDDTDLINWYNDELEDTLKWYQRDIEDIRRER